MRIACATCAAMPAGDEDDLALFAALRARGHEVELPVWDDAGLDWDAFDLTVVRSTWDYPPRRDEYVAWAQRVPRLVNPAEVIAWNTDKRYLSDLQAGGLPVVPTIFCPVGTRLPLIEGEVVVKPTVSAGSKDTQRFTSDDERQAEQLLRFIHDSGREVMVQPYVRSVDVRGETSLLYFGGTFSHAIRKAPLLRRGVAPTNSLFAPEVISPREPTGQERAVGDRVVAWLAQRFGAAPAYARVDLVAGWVGSDRPLVLEVELTEPSLFLAHAEGAADRFADTLTGGWVSEPGGR